MGQAASNAQTAYTQLQTFYNTSTGLYNGVAPWNSANSITTISMLGALDTGIRADVERVLSNTFTQLSPDGFLSANLADEGYWALAMIQAYDLTGNQTYIEAAEALWADMNGDKSEETINAITNELFISVAANLALRTSGNRQEDYATAADDTWQWFQRTGMINSGYTINDGLTIPGCQNNGGTVWTSNQGVILGGLVALSIVRNDTSYTNYATAIASEAIKALTDSEGILAESYDELDAPCSGDAQQYKGIFIRNLGTLAAQTEMTSFQEYIKINARSIWENDLNNGSQLGELWAGPFDEDTYNAKTQSSALDCLVQAARFGF